MIGNRIITRGMGPRRGGVIGRASMVVQGYGGFFRGIVKKAVRLGQSGYKRALKELEEVVVWAKLIRVNDSPPARKIEGTIKVQISKTSKLAVQIFQRASVRVRNVLEDVKITVKRIR